MKNLSLLVLLSCFLCLASLSAFIDTTHIDQHAISKKGMVLVKGGTFYMGLDSSQLKDLVAKLNVPASSFSQEFPANKTMVRSFYMDKHEVTNADFKKFIDANPDWAKRYISDSLHNGNYLKEWDLDSYKKGTEDQPVVYVCWYAAKAYAKWKGKRLPVEAEWEYAAKNGVGLQDMDGSVSEFCVDQWKKDAYAERAERVKELLLSGKRYNYQHRSLKAYSADSIVIRGGKLSSPAANRHYTWRQGYGNKDCSATVGFRCVAGNDSQI
ncbi:formylglycine-generating enzyme required for sulfatase activity [Pedobacter sp. AK017]|uniref:formylglycine-generating enzyme family protein n=1 Tax=Pedobacter sp. AK017 TaxID=2723073 RepID=UPI0016098D1A|nr:SUMF1/EgtB/PvdO family nonheme iron enzyme [Pedobacter sp. AK017]MBB5438488.1 formylglycine-generating enzyme required for sulfatase activity [Pedobacter sp. AK017]